MTTFGGLRVRREMVVGAPPMRVWGRSTDKRGYPRVVPGDFEGGVGSAEARVSRQRWKHQRFWAQGEIVIDAVTPYTWQTGSERQDVFR